MGNICLNRFIHTPAAVFDLAGHCYFSERSDGTPCRIKVGPRRFLNTYVHRDKLRLILLQNIDGKTTYLPNEPVDVTEDEHGTLFIDAVALAKKYFGKDLPFCDTDDWKRHKNGAYSDVFLAGEHGVALHHSAWLDINVSHSTLLFAPGALTLEGHDVRSIYWHTFCEELSAAYEPLRSMVTELLSKPHILSTEDFLRPLKDMALLNEEGFNKLKICTDRGVYDMDTNVAASISVQLDGKSVVPTHYLTKYRTTPFQCIDILLRLMQASSGEEVCARLQDCHQLGLICRKGEKR